MVKKRKNSGPNVANLKEVFEPTLPEQHKTDTSIASEQQTGKIYDYSAEIAVEKVAPGGEKLTEAQQQAIDKAAARAAGFNEKRSKEDLSKNEPLPLYEESQAGVAKTDSSTTTSSPTAQTSQKVPTSDSNNYFKLKLLLSCTAVGVLGAALIAAVVICPPALLITFFTALVAAPLVTGAVANYKQHLDTLKNKDAENVNTNLNTKETEKTEDPDKDNPEDSGMNMTMN